MVLITKDIRKNGILRTILVLDQTHSDTADGTNHLDTGVTHSKCSTAGRSHRRRAIRLKNIGNDANSVGEILGDHSLHGTPCEVTMTNLTTTYATLGLGFASREWREVIVKKELVVAIAEYVIDQLLIELGAKSTGNECLGLTTGEDS